MTPSPKLGMVAVCATCGKSATVCCGDNSNGYYCRECCQHPYNFDGADYGDYGDDGYDEDEEFDCHMGKDGSCGLAGTEECDWECPYNRR